MSRENHFGPPDSPGGPINHEQSVFRQLTDGELSPSEFAEVESRLLTDAHYRERYLNFIRLEASMEETLANVPDEILRRYGPARRRLTISSSSHTRILLASIACLTIIVVGGVLLNVPQALPVRPITVVKKSGDKNSPPRPTADPSTNSASEGGVQQSPASPDDTLALAQSAPQPQAALPGQEPQPSITEPHTPVPESAESAASQFAKLLHQLPEVAVVTHVDELARASTSPPLQLGMRLRPGLLNLQQGRVQLDFLNGAVIVLDGPSKLFLMSIDQATLLSGNVAAKVPEIARGFVLNGPNSAVFDLGTEFTFSVQDGEISEVHVVNGEVEVSLLGDDGNTLQSQRLQDTETVRLSRGMNRVEMAVEPTIAIQPVDRIVAPPLNVSDEYRECILNDGAKIYWRFEETGQNVVRNEAGPEFSATIVPGSHPGSGIQQSQGQLNLSSSSAPRYLEADKDLERLNYYSFSMELWVNPASFHHGGLISVFPADDMTCLRHLVVLELAHRTSVMHRPGAFRFLHRHPPRTQGGLNLFSQQTCVPGQWHHLVATKSRERLRFYLNGEMVRELKIEKASDSKPYKMLLGELRNSTTERQFIGSIDEVAIYWRTLSPEEVGNHYSLMQGSREGR